MAEDGATGLEAQFGSKKWSDRMEAYEALAAAFATDADARATFGPRMPKAVADNNKKSQEAAVVAAAALIRADTLDSDLTEALCNALVKKAFNGRPNMVAVTQDLYFALYENGAQDIATASLLKALTQSSPKIPMAALEMLRAALAHFGPTKVSLKAVLKGLPKMFGHRDGKVREGAMEMAIEVYRHAPQAIRTALADLRSAQLTELETRWAAASAAPAASAAATTAAPTADAEPAAGTSSPKRRRRPRPAQQAVATTTSTEAARETPAEVAVDEPAASQPPSTQGVDIDPYDLADPVDVAAAIGASFYEAVRAKKWQERKEAIEGVLRLASVPRIAPGAFDDLFAALRERIAKDVNVMIVTETANVVAALARGLRSDMAPYAGALVSPLLARGKEKKPVVQAAVVEALEALAPVVDLADVTDAIAAAACHKIPHTQKCALAWAVVMVKKSKPADVRAGATPLCKAFATAMSARDPDVREAAVVAYAHVFAFAGEAAVAGLMAKLDDKKADRVREVAAGIELPRPRNRRAKKKSKGSSGSGGASTGGRPQARSSRPGSAAPASGGSVPAPLAAAVTAESGGEYSSDDNDDDDDDDEEEANDEGASDPALPACQPSAAMAPALNAESLDDRAAALVPSALTGPLASGKWKERLAAAEAFESHLAQRWADDGDLGTDAEVAICFLGNTPGWKYSNFQVMRKVVEIVGALAANTPSFSRSAAGAAFEGIVGKMGDSKLKAAVSDTLVSLCEATGADFVVSAVLPLVARQKSPKVHKDGLEWLLVALTAFGIQKQAVTPVVAFVTTMLGSSNAGVRSAASDVVVHLSLSLRAATLPLFDGINPKLLSSIEAEIAKVAGQSPPAPTLRYRRGPIPSAAPRRARKKSAAKKKKKKTKGGRRPRSAAQPSAAAAAAANEIEFSDEAGSDLDEGGLSESEDDGPDPEDLLPRANIKSKVKESLLKRLNDKKWTVRRDAMEEIENMLRAAGNRIQPNVPTLLNAVKARTSDKNMNLSMRAALLLASVVEAMGPGAARFVKLVAGPLLGMLNDNKAQVRATARTALDTALQRIPIGAMIPAVAKELSVDNATSRREILEWLVPHHAHLGRLGPSDLGALIAPIIAMLGDRSGDVRSGSEGLLTVVGPVVGYRNLMRACKSQKRAFMLTIQPILDNYKGMAAGGATSGEPTSTAASSGGASTADENVAAAPAAVEAPPAEPARTQRRVKRKSTKGGGTRRRKPSSKGAPPRGGRAGGRRGKRSGGGGGDETLLALIANRGKEARARKNRSKAWRMATFRPDLVELLRDQMSGAATQELIDRMFGSDFQKHLEVCGVVAGTDDAVLVDNLDLVLKWMTVRMHDSNTAVAKRVLETLELVLERVDGADYRLTDYEASLFVPVLVERLGASKDLLRAKAHAVLGALGGMYPSSKIFSFVMGGLDSKNNRTRTECLEAATALLARHSLTVCVPGEHLPAIASHVSSPDSKVRGAALGALMAAHGQLGDGLWAHLPDMPDAASDMLKERIRYSNPTPAPVARPASPAAAPMQAEPAPSAPIDGSNATGLDQVEAGTPIVATDAAPAAEAVVAVASDPVSVILDGLGGGADDEAAIQAALSALEAELSAFDAASSPLLGQVDHVVSALVLRLHMAFGGDGTPGRACKHFLNALMEVFKNQALAGGCAEATVEQVLVELLSRLVDDRLAASEEGTVFLRALNVLVLQVMGVANRGYTYGVLLGCLQKAVRSADVESPGGDISSRYIDLVMKCLLKLTRTLKATVDALDVGSLIDAIGAFLGEFPPAWWAAKSNVLPLRTVKTILSELVKLARDDVVAALPAGPSPLREYVEAMGGAAQAAAAAPASEAAALDSDPASAVSAGTTADKENAVVGVVARTLGSSTGPAKPSADSKGAAADISASYRAQLANLRQRFNLPPRTSASGGSVDDTASSAVAGADATPAAGSAAAADSAAPATPVAATAPAAAASPAVRAPLRDSPISSAASARNILAAQAETDSKMRPPSVKAVPAAVTPAKSALDRLRELRREQEAATDAIAKPETAGEKAQAEAASAGSTGAATSLASLRQRLQMIKQNSSIP